MLKLAAMLKSTLYIDESGAPGLIDRRSKHFILTGVLVDHSISNQTESYFEFLKKQHGIKPGTAFHTVDLFEDKAAGIYLTNKKALDLAGALSSFINIAEFEFFSYSLNKDQIRQALKIPKNTIAKDYRSNEVGKQTRDVAYEILASTMFFDYTYSLSDDYKGAIVAESRSSADHALLDAYLLCKEPKNYTDTTSKPPVELAKY